MGQINGLLDESIAGLTIREAGPPAHRPLHDRLRGAREALQGTKHKNIDLEALKAAIRAKLDKLVRLNRTRADFAEKFEALIETYNAGSRNIEELFEELLALQQPRRRAGAPRPRAPDRGGADHLRHPDPARARAEHGGARRGQEGGPGTADAAQGPAGAELATEGAARSALKLAIEDTLDEGLPRAYTPELYRQKCSAVFEHVYESYPERNAGVYA